LDINNEIPYTIYMRATFLMEKRQIK